MLRELQDVNKQYSTLSEEYLHRKAAAEGQVTRWSHATARRFDLGLHDFDRHGWSPGRVVRQAASTKNLGAALGLNDQNQVVVERTYNEISYYETFVTWSGTLVEVAHFDYSPEKRPIYMHRFACAEGRPLALYSAARNGLSVERFEWADEQLKSVQVHHSPRSRDGTFEPPALHHTDELFYRPDGKLQKIEVVWPATAQTATHRSLVFERRSYGIYRKA